ncbi:MAG TPA: hypothetical protein VIT89_10645 [Solirubrobacterales bacterium]
MSKKFMVLALAAVSAAMFALPAVASAGEWENTTKSPFTVSNEGATPIVLTASNGDTVTCTGVSGAGTWSTNKHGTIPKGLDFTGCSAFGFSCSTSGSPAGTITTNALTFTTVYLNSGKTTPGITLKPNSGETFVSFNCFILPVTVHGSINGHIETGCTDSANVPLEFASTGTHGSVKWPYNTGNSAEPFDDLRVTKSGSTFTGSMDATGTVNFGGVTQDIHCV